MAAKDSQNQGAIVVDVMDFGFGWCHASEHHCIVRKSSDRVTTTTATTAEFFTNKFEVRFFSIEHADGRVLLSSFPRRAHATFQPASTSRVSGHGGRGAVDKVQGRAAWEVSVSQWVAPFQLFPVRLCQFVWLQYTVLE